MLKKVAGVRHDRAAGGRQTDVARRCFFLRPWLAGVYIFIALYAPQIVAGDGGVHYEVSFEGISDRTLLSEIKGISDAVGLKDRPPANLGLLRRRAERDNGLFLQLLKARSYYGAQVRADIDPNVEPVKVTFHISTGPPYLLKSADFEISGESVALPIAPPEPQEIGLPLDSPFKARALLDAQKALLQRLGGQGFPFPKVGERKVVVDHATRTVRVTLRIDSGPRARFGNTVVTGLKTVDEELVRGRIPWQEGDPYNAHMLAEVEKRLAAMGLFATVRAIGAEALDERGRLPVTIALAERKHRSVSAGASYKTDEGPGATVSWEHRNIFHRGERLTLNGDISDFTRAAEGNFRKPYFLREDQSLRFSLRLAEDQPDAFKSRNVKSSALIERDLTREIKIGAGLAFKSSRVEQLGGEESFNLLSLPLHLSWDTSDDLLDPSRGGRLGVQFAPFYDITGTDLGFLKGQFRYRRYLQVSRKPDSVLAGKVTLGAMGGAERDEIPADERFYAGGGGSIRGYAFQSVGPLAAGEPIGGRSLLELSGEIRLKLSEQLGVVGFIDGGSAFTDLITDSDSDLRWGTGIGLRYFTPIGPLRIDVGVPLNPRDGVDDSFHVYVNIGQAF